MILDNYFQKLQVSARLTKLHDFVTLKLKYHAIYLFSFFCTVSLPQIEEESPCPSPASTGSFIVSDDESPGE